MSSAGSTCFLKDQILNDEKSIDDSLSFLDGSDECSTPVTKTFSPLPCSSFTYNTDDVLSVHKIESVSNEIHSLSWKGGWPTAITQYDGKIAVGTSEGMLMSFDEAGNLDCVITSSDVKGTVSSLAFAPGGVYIAVGFSKGVVKMVSTRNWLVSHIVTTAVSPGRGVAQVLYFDRVNSFLTLDSGGNVFEVRLTSGLITGKGERIRCVFSGSNGEVVSLKALPYYLIAMMTISKVIIISTRMGGAVVCSFALPDSIEYPHLLDYFKQDSERGIISLCVARGAKLSVYQQVYCNRLGSNQKAVTQPLCVQLPGSIVAVNFVSGNGIVVFDGAGQILFVDSERGTVNRSLKIHLNLMFSSSHQNISSIGHNFSVHLEGLMKNVCCNTLVKDEMGILVLTRNGVFRVEEISEIDQVKLYRQRSDHVSSCLYLCDLITGRIICSTAFKEVIEFILIDELRSLLSLVTESSTTGISYNFSNHKAHTSTILHVCITCNQFAFLYDDVWPRMDRDEQLRNSFLELIGPYVLDEKLLDIRPWIVSAFLEKLSSDGRYSEIQRTIVHLPLHSLHVPTVMSVCRRYNLYDSIIYLMNNANYDYLSPLEEMMEIVAHFVFNDDKSGTELEQGNRLLLYIHRCLAGLAYHCGNLPEGEQYVVPQKVLDCITSLRGKNDSFSTLDYPYLRLLLLFDAVQFIQIISACCDAPVFQSNDRLHQLTKILCLLAKELHTESIFIHLLSLIVQLVTNNLIVPDTTTVEHFILNLLRMNSENPAVQSCILEVLRVIPGLNGDDILLLSQSPLRISIYSYICLREHKYADLIQHYLSDQETYSNQLFSAIREIMCADIPREEALDLTEYIFSLIPKLADINAVKCAQLIVDFFPDYFSRLVSTDAISRLQYARIIQPAFQICRNRRKKSLTGDQTLDEKLFEIVFETVLAQSHPDKVDDILEDLLSYWLPLGSLADVCLNWASENSCTNTMIVLFEARNQLDRAFAVIYSLLESVDRERDILIRLDQALAFCSRHEHLEVEKQWLMKIFEYLITISTKCAVKKFDTQIKCLIRRIVSRDSQESYNVFLCLLEYPSFAAGTYGEYFSLIDSMLSACSFETTKLTDVIKCMDTETTTSLSEFSRLFSKTITGRPIGPYCFICLSSLTESASIFQCGHLVHIHCQDGAQECPCNKSEGTGLKLCIGLYNDLYPLSTS